MRGPSLLPPWRREALRTTLWVIPLILLLAAVALFLATYRVDHQVYQRHDSLPSWVWPDPEN